MATKQFDRINVYFSGQACIVSGASDETACQFGDLMMPIRGDASATELEPGVWYLNRMLVQPESARGQGLGTQLLNRLLESISSKPEFQHILVEPGGYGVDPERQLRFYTKYGFKLNEDQTAYQWLKEYRDDQAKDEQEVPASAQSAG